MDTLFFIGVIVLFILTSIAWGFKTLPKENWQILAVLPRKKNGQGGWNGLNLTYYGFLCANAYTCAVFIFLILSGSMGIPMTGLVALTVSLLMICMPSAKLIARIVEKKTNTLTVGGAVFAGALAAPWIVLAVNHTFGKMEGFEISVIVFLSAISIAYAYGEGLGRLACVSFGCCYGKPLAACSPRVRHLFSRFNLVFNGKTKKIAYADDLDGQPVIPIQIITAVIYSVSAVFGTWLFLNNYFAAALLETIIVTQVWRFLSEFLRADFRGRLAITPYQVMSLLTIPYLTGAILFFPPMAQTPQLSAGLSMVWNPWMILFLQLIWIITFLYTGRSAVTGSRISLHVIENKI